MPGVVRIPIIGALLVAPGCGVREPSDLPPKPSTIGTDGLSREPLELEKLWAAFADALALNYVSPIGETEIRSKTRDTILSELSSFPGLIDESRFANTTAKLTRLFTEDLENRQDAAGVSSVAPNPSYATRCARIKQLTELTKLQPYDVTVDQPLEGVRLFKMEYFLKDENPALSLGLVESGLGDQIVRSALVTLPPTRPSGPSAPLALYGHGGANGLTYKEIAELFGDLQQDFVVAAPSFPTEPICEAEINFFTNPPTCLGEAISEAAGELRPFDTDANELLGVADCLTRALYSQSREPTVAQLGLEAPLDASDPSKGDFAPLLAERLVTYGALENSDETGETEVRRLARQAHPKTMIFGSSRGAASSLIALAKTGAAVLSGQDNLETISHVQCAAFLFPPTTFTMGRLRIALELFVKGLSEVSIFSFLPTAEQLADFFKDYREGNAELEETVSKFIAIDPLLNIHLIASALRDWSQPLSGPGKLLLLHGRQDKVVGPENSKFFGEFMPKASSRVAAAKQAPGVITTALSFAPPSTATFPSGQLLSLFQHGDSVFRNSLSVPDSSSAPQRALDLEELRDSAWNLLDMSQVSGLYNETLMTRSDLGPFDALKLWLQSDCGVTTESP